MAKDKKAMSKTQLEYAKDRLKGIFHEKQSKLRDKHTTPAKKLTYRQAIAMIKDGVIKPNKSLDLDHDVWSMNNVFDLSAFNGSNKLDEKGYYPEYNKLYEAYIKAQDELVLGDCDNALSAIEAFMKVKV